MTDPRPNRFAVPLEQLDGPGGEQVAEVGEPSEVPDWSSPPGSDADADGE